MYVKSFFAQSVPAAMEQARIELGPDSLLLDARDAPPEARHLGDYEVVFGVCSQAAAAPPPSSDNGVPALRRQMEEIRGLLRSRGEPAISGRGPSNAVERWLMEAGVEPALASEIDQAARQRAARRAVPSIGPPRPASRDESPLPSDAADEIAARFAVAPEIGRFTALVGPPGAGKTTTLVKLAITQGLARGRAVRLISTDTARIGGAEHLRTYAAILGVPFQAVETTGALAQALDEAPPAALVLIDTPGYSATMLCELGGDLAAFLGRCQDIDTHLVLTASMRLEDLYNTAALYNPFRPAKLLFTRADETSSLAAVFCVAARCRKPVSFLANGQAIPEDLEPAAKERIVESLVPQLPAKLRAIA
jgi:flagellar biosynthesis protein FlhF